MIAFKYTKIDGAEFLSHLDLLRHINRTLKRAGIKVKTSEGFHPHARIYMNNPLGLGIKSLAEYCAVDTDFDGDFTQVFNAHSPQGIKCLGFTVTDENPNYAYTMQSCVYSVKGVAPFDIDGFLKQDEIIITDKRGRTVDIRPRIYGIERKGDELLFTLGCGENNLRPDLFAEVLEAKFGGKAYGLIKLSAHGKFTQI